MHPPICRLKSHFLPNILNEWCHVRLQKICLSIHWSKNGLHIEDSNPLVVSLLNHQIYLMFVEQTCWVLNLFTFDAIKERFFLNKTSPTTERNDICLMFAKTPFEMDGKTVAPIPLGDYSSCRVGDACVISGFGSLEVKFDFKIIFL